MERTVGPDVVDRSRVAALVAVEMLVVLATPLERRALTAASRIPRRPDEPRARGALGPVARHFARDGWRSYGLAGTFERDVVGRWAGTLELTVEAGSVELDMGGTDALIASAALGPALHLRGRGWATTVGINLRAGVVDFKGEAPPGATERHLVGAWLGPAASVHGWIPVGAALIHLGLDTGIVLRPVQANIDGEPAVSVAGPWFGISVGVGTRI